MPLAGGVPTRRTYEGEAAVATAFTPSGELVVRDDPPRHPPRPAARGARPRRRRRERSSPEPGQRGVLRRHRQDALLRAARVPQQRDEALPGRHGPQDLEARGGRARGRLPDLRLRRREPLPAVVERPRLLRERSRRHDEPVVDGRRRPATSGSTRTTAAGTSAIPPSTAGGSSTRWAPTCGSTTSPRERSG